MASSSSNKKNVAIGKRAKIDSAQKHMLIFVGSASVLLGVTVVAVIYFAKLISFNTKVISAKRDVVDAYVSTQESLNEISKKIAGLSVNEYLESVARLRDEDCKDYQTAIGETVKLSDLERVRECSALRVITDALPYSKNADTALTSFYLLNVKAGEAGASLDTVSGSEFESIQLGEDGSVKLSTMSVAAEFSDEPGAILESLKYIEKSVRNYEISRATISYGNKENGGQILTLSSSFTAFFADVSGLTNQKLTVCAKADNEKCTAAGGDGSIVDLSQLTEDY